MSSNHRRTPRAIQLVLLWGAILLYGANAGADEQPGILVVGDSLSAAYGIALEQGWVHLLQERLHDRGYPHGVVNASISGDTSAGGLSRLPAALERHHPAILVLELGANDALRGQSLDRLEQNLGTMIELGRAGGAEILLLGMLIPPNYGPAYTQQFLEVFPTLAQRYGTSLVPFMLAGVADKPGLMQNDGLHPNALAQPTILDNVWSELEPLLAAD